MDNITLDDIFEKLPGAKRRKHADKNYLSGLCPFHEDRRPSLMVYEDGFFRCLACGRVGTHRTLLRSLDGWLVSYQPERTNWHPPTLPTSSEAMELYAKMAYDTLVGSEQLQWYLQMRGVDELIDMAMLGWQEGWYVFPIRDRFGKVVGLKIRAGPHIQQASGGEMRFAQPKGQPYLLYVPDWTRFSKERTVGITFGIFDALALNKMGFASCTSTGGQDGFSPAWLDPYRGHRFVIIPDKGEEIAAERLAAKLGTGARTLYIDYPDGIKDPAGFLEKGRDGDLLRVLAGPMS